MSLSLFTIALNLVLGRTQMLFDSSRLGSEVPCWHVWSESCSANAMQVTHRSMIQLVRG